MNVVGELVLVKTACCSSPSGSARGEETRYARARSCTARAARLERKLDELQDGHPRGPDGPARQIFDKLARMVRKIARELGKEVELQVTGGDVELDKLIVEELSDPLMHLIRNAIDHAIEPPERRARAGKPRAGPHRARRRRRRATTS